MEIVGNFQTSVITALDDIDKDWRDYDGLIVCGSHTPQNPDDIIEMIRLVRENRLPTLLICYGYQLGCIEYFRNIKGIKDATSEEFGTGTLVVKKRNEPKVGLYEGESWWSYYEAEDWPIPNNFVAVPYHPEYQSTKENPHQDLLKFINLCKQNIAGRHH